MVCSEQYLARAASTYNEDIQVLLKTLNHLLLSHAATPIQQRLVKFWNFLCSALGACFILFCPLKGHLMLWSWGCYCSAAKSCMTLWDPMDCSIPGIPILHCVLEFAQTHVHWVDDAIQPFRPLSPLPPPAFSLSQHQGLFASGGQSIGASASASMPSNEYSGLISFRNDWFGLLAVQGILNSLLQHHNSKASILGSSQLSLWSNSLICTCTGKTIALTIWTFVSKVMSLLFHMLSRFVIAFLPGSKHLLVSRLQSAPTVFWSLRK